MEIVRVRRDIRGNFLVAMWIKHKKLILAILGSVLIHLVLLAVFAQLLARNPPPQATRADKPIRLQIIPEEKPLAPIVVATPPPRRHAGEAGHASDGDRPPEDTLLEAEKNSVARSELAPTGSEPLPSQNGRISPALGFETHPSVAAAENPAQAAPTTEPLPETAPPLPRPDAQVPRSVATPPSAPTLAPTPAPTAAPDEFAMLEPTPTPKPPDFDPFVRDPQTESSKPNAIAAAKPSQSLSSEEKTQIRGNLTNRGLSSLAALATPQGRYSKAVGDAVKISWVARIRTGMDVASFGTVKIRFVVDRRGKVIEPHVVSNSGNEALAAISLEAIMDANIPPVPPDVAAASRNMDIPLDFDFSLY